MTTGLPYLGAFLLTCLVELPLYVVLLRGRGGVRARTVGLACVAANVLTHPPLWLAVASQDSAGGYLVAFLCGEALVCVAEWLVVTVALRRHPLPMGLTASVAVLANMASAGCGLVIVVLFGVVS